MSLQDASSLPALIGVDPPDRSDQSATTLLSLRTRGSEGVVAGVVHRGARDSIAVRLEALGFVAGERVRVVATGPLGGEPLVVLVGSARFALRHAEADRVLMQDVDGAGVAGVAGVRRASHG